jgi:Flp pilus assembly protein TadD
LGVCLARLGRLDEAIGHFEHASRLAPGDEVIRKNLDQARRVSNRRGPGSGGRTP